MYFFKHSWKSCAWVSSMFNLLQHVLNNDIDFIVVLFCLYGLKYTNIYEKNNFEFAG